LAGLAARPVDGDLPNTAEERPAGQALDALAGEVLGLREEHHLARQRLRAEEVIGEREVVARQDDRAAARHVPASARPGTEHNPQGYAQRVLSYPVEHGYIVPRLTKSMGRCKGVINITGGRVAGARTSGSRTFLRRRWPDRRPRPARFYRVTAYRAAVGGAARGSRANRAGAAALR